MGACCEHTMDPAEEHIRSVLENKNFLLNKLTYDQLFDRLCDIRKPDQTITKPMLEKILVSSGFFYNLKGNNLINYHQSLIRYILNNCLKETNNLYTVIFYFFSFLNLKDQKDYIDRFYDMFNFMNEGVLQYDTLRTCVKNYIEFNTKTLSEVFMNLTDDQRTKESYRELLLHVYTNENIEKETLILVEGLIENPKADSLIDASRFSKHFTNKKIAHYTEIRERFINY